MCIPSCDRRTLYDPTSWVVLEHSYRIRATRTFFLGKNMIYNLVEKPKIPGFVKARLRLDSGLEHGMTFLCLKPLQRGVLLGHPRRAPHQVGRAAVAKPRKVPWTG